MKPIICLVVATIAVVFAAPVQAQVDCANWNTATFFEAAELSDVTRCLQAGADPNARAGNGQTPLHFVVGNGTAEAVTTLLNAGADPNARTVVGNTPLHFTEHAEPVAALLEAGADPNARDENGHNALHFAEYAETVTVLLDAGSDPMVRAWNGETPLHRAKTSEAVTALLQTGVDLEAQDEDGRTPLHTAAAYVPVIGGGHAGAAIEALLDAGADPAARDTNCKLPFDYAADNEQLKGTDAYWKLNDARFQSSGSGTGPGEEIGGGVFRVGCGVSAPQAIFKVEPEYSVQARQARHGGTVVLNLVVQRDGTVRNVRVVQSLGMGLDEKAVEAVQKWRFRPGMKNGKPVDVASTIEFTFSMR